jgi:hypothetical protein
MKIFNNLFKQTQKKQGKNETFKKKIEEGKNNIIK